MLSQIQIRPIQLADNTGIAQVIRTTLKEFGANKPGTVYFDSSTDHLFELFQVPGAMYQVALLEGEIVGGGGIYPTEGLPADTCELVKMYVLKKVRGIGLGRDLIQKSLDYAKEVGYKKVYLETMPELQQALATYQKFGFKYINQPLGNSGHFGCDLWKSFKARSPARPGP
jgi:putative acetyltransferase